MCACNSRHVQLLPVATVESMHGVPLTILQCQYDHVVRLPRRVAKPTGSLVNLPLVLGWVGGRIGARALFQVSIPVAIISP